MSTCSDYKNLGTGKCPIDFTAIRRFILVPLVGSDGTENSLSAADALLKEKWQEKFDAANQLDRFYPTPKGRNITAETADPQAESFDDGSSIFLSDGPITHTALFPLKNFRLREALNSFRGKEVGVIYIDQSGNIAFNNKDGDGTVYPLALDADAMLNSKPMLPTDGSSAKVDLTFQLDRTIDFSDFGIIKRDDLDFNPLSEVDVYALDDITITISNEAQTGFTMKVEDFAGNPVEGIVKADVAVYNTTSAATVEITTVTPQTALTGAVGTYDVVIPSQTLEDVCTMSLSFSGYEPTTATVTVPAA